MGESSPPKVFCRKVIPRNFAKFTGKHLCQKKQSTYLYEDLKIHDKFCDGIGNVTIYTPAQQSKL